MMAKVTIGNLGKHICGGKGYEVICSKSGSTLC